MQERKEFVGKVDPASGYQCRFTFSSTWQCKDDIHSTLETLDRATFAPSPPNFIRMWIDGRLLHRSVSMGKSIANTAGYGTPRNQLLTYVMANANSDVLERYAYPASISTHSILRHLRINGYAATYTVDLIPITGYHEMRLNVYMPEGIVVGLSLGSLLTLLKVALTR